MITYSIEKLFHFKCTCCKKWWSIGDFQLAPRTTLRCPFCGHVAEPIHTNPQPLTP